MGLGLTVPMGPGLWMRDLVGRLGLRHNISPREKGLIRRCELILYLSIYLRVIKVLLSWITVPDPNNHHMAVSRLFAFIVCLKGVVVRSAFAPPGSFRRACWHLPGSSMFIPLLHGRTMSIVKDFEGLRR